MKNMNFGRANRKDFRAVMKKQKTILLLFFIFLTACTPQFDRQVMLGNVANAVILPAHKTFVAETAILDAQANAFVAAPSAESLAVLQDAWLNATLAWKKVELYSFGETMLLHTSIEKRPANDKFIEEFIATEPQIDEVFIEGIGSTAKGLPAIEYLIFDSDGDTARLLERFADSQRGAYLTALTAYLHTRAEALYAYWSPGGGNYVQTFTEAASDGTDLQGSISLLANELIALNEMLIRDKIGRPLGKSSYGDPHPEFAESYLSGHSLELAIANVEAMQMAFHAGLDEYLVFLGGQVLAEQISTQFDTTLSDLRAIDVPLEEAVLTQPEKVERAYESLRSLLTLFKTDMVNQLGITITFNDNDGD
ncbi:MAG: hypothetical protein Fur0022_47710 [Anaerolineales bacterium]